MTNDKRRTTNDEGWPHPFTLSPFHPFTLSPFHPFTLSSCHPFNELTGLVSKNPQKRRDIFVFCYRIKNVIPRRPHLEVDLMSHLTLALLGPPQIEHNDVPITFAYHKVTALLVYLAVEARQAHSRQTLAELFWPDVSERGARQSLSQALTTLRTTLGERKDAPSNKHAPMLLIDTETIRLNPAAAWTTDVAQFQALLAACEAHRHHAWRTCPVCAERLRTATTLYRSDFLAQFTLRDSSFFEEWTQVLRERLRRQMLDALERLAEQAEWRNDYPNATAYVERQIALDPLFEGPHHELIRLLAIDRRPHVALAHYAQFRQLLQQEFYAEPGAATQTLVAQIQRALDDIGALRRFTEPPLHAPKPPSTFLGRDEALRALRMQLCETTTHAMTLCGPPGVGKTRLALELAHTLRYDFADGVWFVELAPLNEAALVPEAIAQALGVRPTHKQTIPDALIATLRDRHALLILDNFEHVHEAAPLVAALVANCPALTILTTSRTPLHIHAEQQYMLEPLPLSDERATYEEIAGAASVQLLVARAQAIRPSFTVTPANAPILAQLCARLDGLPLAIELIAARCATIDPTEVLRRLDARLASLAGGPRDLPARQQTLRSAIAWSGDRLSDEERRVFAHLGMFVGGCTLDAIGAVAGDMAQMTDQEPFNLHAPIAHPQSPIADSITALVQQSLVKQITQPDGTHRYVLLETIRAYALEQLAARGELEIAQQRHALYHTRMAQAAYTGLLGADSVAWSTRLTAELDNLRAAHRWGLDHAPELALRLATGVWRFFHWQHGSVREGLAWIEAAHERANDAPLEVQTKAFRAAGVLAARLNEQTRALELFEAARDTALRAEESYDYAGALTNLGLLLGELGRFDEAYANLNQAIIINRTMTDNPAAVKFPMIILAELCCRMGDVDRAEDLYSECLQLNRELRDQEGTGNALWGLGMVAQMRGDYPRATELCDEGFAVYAALHNQFGLGWMHQLSGHITRGEGRLSEALAAYRRSLAIWRERADPVNGVTLLDDIAKVLCDQGEWEPAVRIIGATHAIRAKATITPTPKEQTEHEHLQHMCRAKMGDDAYYAAWEEGAGLTFEEAANLAQERGKGEK
jgi:predicted ATPase/DNA-binding SARP family transcriptional activator